MGVPREYRMRYSTLFICLHRIGLNGNVDVICTSGGSSRDASFYASCSIVDYTVYVRNFIASIEMVIACTHVILYGPRSQVDARHGCVLNEVDTYERREDSGFVFFLPPPIPPGSRRASDSTLLVVQLGVM